GGVRGARRAPRRPAALRRRRARGPAGTDRAGRSAPPHVADRAAAVRAVGAPRDGVRGVALDGGDGAVGADGVDDADVLIPDDQVAGLGLAARGGDRLAGALGPRPHVVDAAEALPGVAERDPRL